MNKHLLRSALFLSLGLLVFGCASTHSVDVKYTDLSPKYTVGTVFCESTDPTGVNAKTIDRYIIDKDGNCQAVKQDSASAAGPVAAVTQSAISSGAATAIVGPIMGQLIPAATTNVTVKTESK